MKQIVSKQSIDAFRSIIPKMGERQDQVTNWLEEYVKIKNNCPTVRELAEWVANTNRCENKDVVRIIGRTVSQLEKRCVIHRKRVRECKVTGRRASEWSPGKSGSIIPPSVQRRYKRIVERYSLLAIHAKGLSSDDGSIAAEILGIGIEELQKAIAFVFSDKGN